MMQYPMERKRRVCTFLLDVGNEIMDCPFELWLGRKWRCWWVMGCEYGGRVNQCFGALRS